MVIFSHAVNHHSGHITKLGIVGAGQVVREKLGPVARRRKGTGLQRIVVCSLEADCPLIDFADDCRQVESDSLLPMDYLYEDGPLSHDTLSIIATRSPFHVTYALQLAELCRVAIEKPIAPNGRQGKFLLPLANTAFEVHTIDRKLLNISPANRVNTSFTPVGNCADSPSHIIRAKDRPDVQHLQVFEEGTGHPVELPFCRPVDPPDGGEAAAGRVKIPPGNRGANPTGNVTLPRADRGKVAADLVLKTNYEPSEAGEIVLLPHHDVVRARTYIYA